jgi:4-carboxymuconolactone decarboxylase
MERTTKMIEPRVSPLKPEELDARQQAFLAPFTDAKGRYANIFGVLCRNMPLMEAWRDFGLFTMNGATTDPIFREVLILRTSELSKCAYEWHHHERIARALGMTEDRLRDIRHGTVTGDEDHDLAMRCADELAADKRLSEGTWNAMIARFGLDTTLDAIFTVGAYTALAMGLNSCGVPVEGRAAS